MANDRIEAIYRFSPSSELLDTTLALVAGDLAGYSLGAREIREIPPSERWGLDTPSVKISLLGLTGGRLPKFGPLSDAAVKATALTANQGLRVTIDSTNFADKPVAVGVFVAQNATSEHFLAAIVPIPAASLRNNIAHGTDLVVDIAKKPNSSQLSESQLNAKRSSNTDPVLGVISFRPDLGLGDDGVTLSITPETFESRTNGSTSTFNSGVSANISISVNPATESQLEEALSLAGFDLVGGTLRKAGAPESLLPAVEIWDMDLSPYVFTSGKNRVMVFGVAARTLDELSLQKSFTSKEPFTMSFTALETDFIPNTNLIAYSRQ